MRLALYGYGFTGRALVSYLLKAADCLEQDRREAQKRGLPFISRLDVLLSQEAGPDDILKAEQSMASSAVQLAFHGPERWQHGLPDGVDALVVTKPPYPGYEKEADRLAAVFSTARLVLVSSTGVYLQEAGIISEADWTLTDTTERAEKRLQHEAVWLQAFAGRSAVIRAGGIWGRERYTLGRAVAAFLGYLGLVHPVDPYKPIARLHHVDLARLCLFAAAEPARQHWHGVSPDRRSQVELTEALVSRLDEPAGLQAAWQNRAIWLPAETVVSEPAEISRAARACLAAIRQKSEKTVKKLSKLAPKNEQKGGENQSNRGKNRKETEQTDGQRKIVTDYAFKYLYSDSLALIFDPLKFDN